MSSARVIRILAATGVGAAGLLAGHAVAYDLALSGAAYGHEALAHSGHGYLPVASRLAFPVAFAGLIAVFGLGFVRGGHRTGMPKRRRAVALAGTQTLSFLLLEVGERLWSGAGLGDLAGPLLVVGVLVQLIVGVLVQLLLRGAERTGELLGAGVPRPRRVFAVVLTPRDRVPVSRLRPGAALLRGPPLLLGRSS